MKLLDLPEEVIEGHILPYLKWNDLLRFRRVCQTTKFITDGFLNVHPELAPEIEIDEGDKSFGNFLEMGIPTTKIYLRNYKSAYTFFTEDFQNMKIFLVQYGPLIKSLRVDQLSTIVFGEELLFMEGLVNLQNLTIGHFNYGIIGGGDITSQTEEQMTEANRVYLSRVGEANVSLSEEHAVTWKWKNPTLLKVLKIGQQENVWPQVRKKVDLTGIKVLMQYCTSLEYVAIPFVSHSDVLEDPRFPEHARQPENWVTSTFAFFVVYMEKQVNSSGKTIDFVNFHDPRIPEDVNINGASGFPSFCQLCVDNGVMLRNVPSFWFSLKMHHPDLMSCLREPILSLVGIHPAVVSVDMPTLERIEIKATSTSCAGYPGYWRAQRQQWPALKELDITVDSVVSATQTGLTQLIVSTETKTLFQFFFRDVVRPEMTELRLNFVKDAGSVAVPKTREIVASCPNLKKLTLINWPGTNKALIELFGGLPRLEEISLECCKGLGNVAFVGTDARSPVFFKLKRLKKLTLKGLDQMPKITDLLFSMVLCHMPLTHLTLTSDSPVTTVSSKGIRALLERDLAKSIEKFSMERLCLDGVSAADLQELEKQFRSYDMI